MDRYLIKEFGWVFMLSVSLLTSLGVSVGNVSDLAYKITEQQLPISVAIIIFCGKIPEYAAYALPISSLLTGLVVYSRCRSDQELVALFSFGISFYRIMLPTLIFSLVITAVTFLLTELVVPAANYQANLLQSSFIPVTELNLQKQDIFYAEYESSLKKDVTKKLKNIYFAEKYVKPSLKRITIISYQRDRLSQIVTAKSAHWNQQLQVWDLASGMIYRFVVGEKTIINQFEVNQLSLPKTMFEIVNQERSPEEMSIHQARIYLNLIKDSGQPTYVAQFAVRIQQKYAFPFICIVFTIIGSALGASYGQLNRAKSFALCVVIVFIYYCLGFALGSLGITRVISPFWAAWLPNLIVLMVGIYLLRAANN